MNKNNLLRVYLITVTSGLKHAPYQLHVGNRLIIFCCCISLKSPLTVWYSNIIVKQHDIGFKFPQQSVFVSAQSSFFHYGLYYTSLITWWGNQGIPQPNSKSAASSFLFPLSCCFPLFPIPIHPCCFYMIKLDLSQMGWRRLLCIFFTAITQFVRHFFLKSKAHSFICPHCTDESIHIERRALNQANIWHPVLHANWDSCTIEPLFPLFLSTHICLFLINHLPLLCFFTLRHSLSALLVLVTAHAWR